MAVYLFDFDGTLVDSTGAVEKALRIAIEKTVPAVIESDLYEDYYKALALFIKGRLTYQYLGVIHELVAQGTIHEYYKLMPRYIKDFPHSRNVVRTLRKRGRYVISFSGEHTYPGGKVIFMKRTNWYDEFDEVITFRGTKDMLKKFENLRELYPDEPFVWVDDSPSRFTYILDENTLLVQKASPYKSDVALLFERQNFLKIKSLREILEIDDGLSACTEG
ncbi:haloacid dehalogenase [Thermococcus celericrescens]|uniref:Haloacid dehalogenase n=2 Tax=Thermococcus TaxID=2263 RepID=A0A100XW62_9EURY|nr:MULTISPECIES: HAD family hydrolase [Thermococcus]KUH32201.1 haloacid dehalogenase [Thermococcus celericrescens]QEK14095.1 haloacid dehalogenase [Thermococcus aciditolerans]